MTHEEFKERMTIIKSHPNTAYATGYQRGLRKHYHGADFGTPEEHEKWMSLSDDRVDLGDGYRDGFAGCLPRGYASDASVRSRIRAVMG